MSGPVATAGADETRAVGARLAPLLRGGDVVLLVGPLGAGKTTLVQGVVSSLGGDEPATSPTFTLAHTYRTTPPVTHVDLWRLERLQEVVDLALEEALDSGGVVMAEWGEAAEPLYGADSLVVRLGWGAGDDERTIVFEPRGPSWQRRARALDVVVEDSRPTAGSG